MKIEQNYVIRILIVLSSIFLLKIFFEDASGDVEKWFDTSSYDENDNRPLQIGFFKDELGGNIMKKNCALRPKAYADLMDDGSGKKKVKGTKNV